MQAIRPFGVPNPGIWRNRPCRCFPENASVEFGPISGDVGKLEKARVFWIGEYAKELKTLTSESGKQYHLQYIACTAQGAFYRATVYDGDTIVETWAVQRIDKYVVDNGQEYVGPARSLQWSNRDKLMDVKVMLELGNRNPTLQGIEEYLEYRGEFPMNFQVMPWPQEGDLIDFIGRNGHQPAQVVYLVAQQLLNALIHKHCNGLCHMSVSPDNVLVMRDMDGQQLFVLYDFGFATDSALAGIDNDNLKPYDRRGKRLYWAPEVYHANGVRPYDGFKADIYSLGCLLFSVYCGHPPPRDNETGNLANVDLMREKLTHKFMQSNELQQGPWLRDRILEMVRTHPDQRPCSRRLAEDFSLHQSLQPPVQALQEEYVETFNQQRNFIAS